MSKIPVLSAVTVPLDANTVTAVVESVDSMINHLYEDERVRQQVKDNMRVAAWGMGAAGLAMGAAVFAVAAAPVVLAAGAVGLVAGGYMADSRIQQRRVDQMRRLQQRFPQLANKSPSEILAALDDFSEADKTIARSILES